LGAYCSFALDNAVAPGYGWNGCNVWRQCRRGAFGLPAESLHLLPRRLLVGFFRLGRLAENEGYLGNKGVSARIRMEIRNAQAPLEASMKNYTELLAQLHLMGEDTNHKNIF
jgi:hypothetical protein